jgi:hypothetical protein
MLLHLAYSMRHWIFIAFNLLPCVVRTYSIDYSNYTVANESISSQLAPVVLHSANHTAGKDAFNLFHRHLHFPA